jgi:drug/metabolite transporter (DMT)-like permease
VTLVAPVASITPILTLLLAKVFISRLEPITRRVLWGTVFTVGGVVVAVLGSTI